ncbi:42491_t:CDS:2, partial [Gigaspora margarita]
KQVISSYKRLNSIGTEALATELRLKQGFNDARIVNLWQIEQGGTPLNVVLGKVFNRKTADALKRLNLFTTVQLISADGFKLITWSQLMLCRKQFRQDRKSRWFIALENCLIGNRRNRKLVPKYVISGYNLLALSIVLLAKGKDKILGEHYCNIPLADPNQFEIKKCKGYSENIAKMTGKIDKEVCMSYFSWNKILGTLPRSYIKEEKRILN